MEIWKYKLNIYENGELEMPDGAVPLSVQSQNGQPCLWAMVDPEKELVLRKFRIIGTGHKFNNSFKHSDYIGTFQQAEGFFIWHLFEVR